MVRRRSSRSTLSEEYVTVAEPRIIDLRRMERVR
jgi:hypothetical protein